MEKTKKKNAILRVAVVLFALTLLSTGLLGGTLAKYVSTGTVTDNARVAKWGVNIDATGSLFANTYATDEEDGYGESLTVNAEGLVVAPGTKGTLASFKVSGKPEVASRLSVTVDDSSKIEGWDYSTDYEPVLWTLKIDSDKTVDGGTFEDLKDGLEAITADFDPLYDFAGFTTAYEISWKWPFESGNDAGDTYYGNLAAGLVDDKTAPTITLKFDITLTQID